ncbi:uncharacterized protein RSE6_07822 [Rhynchosporium secalis]|uniref:Uncharacterized protein n=1 Tax=Rhynchosporium secalis TaxID=38038 RepID=A0A1E1MDU6_RHYSE|nr:uncharacterized protein RSE6_07822 [Rhynchosporium secalis]
MLPPAPTCRRALQRQLHTPPDSIWISDEALCSVFQSFCAVSKTRKRYGSFVPGPLENRRRLGKRRMTLQSNAAPTPSSGVASLWGFLSGEVDRQKWQWQAPTSRDTRVEEASSGLPQWLEEWATFPKAPSALPERLMEEEIPRQDLDTTAQNTATSRRKARAITFMGEIRSFGQAIKSCNPEDKPGLCDNFNQNLTEVLSLSIHAERIFLCTMQHVFRDLEQAFADSNEESQRSVALCLAMWKGISKSKVLRPSDFMGKTMKKFARIFCELPMTEALQSLVGNILPSVSKTQLQVMHSSIARLANSWVLSWQETEPMDLDETSIFVAAESVLEATRAVNSLSTMIVTQKFEPHAEGNLIAIHEALQLAKEAITSSANSLREAELKIRPHQRSIKALTSALSSLPPGIVRTIIDQCSARIPAHTARTKVDTVVTMQWKWLSFVFQLPDVSERVLLSTWQKYGALLDQAAASKILLDHWMSHGLLERPALTRIVFDVTSSQRRRASRKNFANLLRIMKVEKERDWHKLIFLFNFLNKLGHHETIYKTLVALNDGDLRIPADIMDEILEKMAIANPPLALKSLRTYMFMRFNDAPLRLERCPNLIFAMIGHDPSNTPTIWKLLGIPIYENLPRSTLAKISNYADGQSIERLRPITVEHFTTMATLFAHCNQISQRIAFRNVMQCLFHLRRHRAPITPEFTRALVYAGIARKIETDGWIAKERHEWILSLVERVEGTEVAMSVDEVVGAWNEFISLRVSKRDRGNGIAPKW